MRLAHVSVGNCVLLASGGSAIYRPQSLQYWELGAEIPVQIRAPLVAAKTWWSSAFSSDDSKVWNGAEVMGHTWKASKTQTRNFHVVRNLLLPDEIQLLRSIADENSSHIDSVDGRLAFETYFVSGTGNIHELPTALLPAIEERIMPYIRVKYSCPACVLCTALARRYRPEERRAHPHHCDNEAYITAIVALNGPEDFTGGLYVQTSDRVDSRKYITLNVGDMVFHQYDLKHGVNVEQGLRYSAIFWIKDSANSCKSKTTPWYDHDAAKGDADAQYSLGYQYQTGMYGGVAIDYSAAMSWYTKAAEQGHADAQINLAWMHQEGMGVPRSDDSAVFWLEKAADQVHSQALENLAGLYDKGYGGSLMRGRAFDLRLQAANHGLLDAQVNLASMLLQGRGTEPNATLGAHWMSLAAEQGDPDAQFNLGQLYTFGHGVLQDDTVAASWFQKAAAGGQVDAKKALDQIPHRVEL